MDAYENKRYPIDDPDPISALKSVMDDKNLKSVDLGNLIGGRSRVTEILNRKRKLTLERVIVGMGLLWMIILTEQPITWMNMEIIG